MGDYAERLKIALAAASAGTWDWDMTNGQLRWSDELFALFGLNPQEHEATFATWQSLIHPDDYASARDQIQVAIDNHIELVSEYRFLMPDGTVHWINARGRTTYDEEGRPLRMSGICLDITGKKMQEELLQRSERMTAGILNASTEAILLIDNEGVILKSNTALQQRFGKGHEELMGVNNFSLVDEDVSAFRRSKLAEVISTRQPLRFEETREGLIIDSQLYPVIDADGSVTTVAIFSRDITENKKNLDQLNYVNECFAQALNGAQHHILYRLNVRDGCYDYLSPAFERITGHPVAEFKQTSLEQLKAFFHPDDRNSVFAAIDEAVRTRGTDIIAFELEYRLRKADGNYCWLHDSCTASLDDAGEAELFFGSAYDISERKQMEIDLRASEERYRTLIATANEGIGISDRNYNITYVNKYFAEMLGYEPHELIGTHAPNLLHDSELGKFNTNIADRKSGISGCIEYLYRRKDGTYICLLTSSTPIIDSSGIFQGGFSMFTDLTDRKNAEKALLQANDDLEKHVRERTSALMAANEELKLVSLQLIQAEEQERMRIAAELHDQVGQSLLLAKIKLDILAADNTSAAQCRETETVSLIIENAIQDIRTLTFGMRPPLLDTAGLEAALEWLCPRLHKDYGLQVAYRRHEKPLPIPAEQLFPLYQAVRELLLNVTKHSGVDKAELSLEEEAGTLIIRVTDSGTGFTGDQNQAHLGSTDGFGLYNVQRRIAQLGGQCTIATSAAGTDVTLIIPLQQR